MNSTRLPYIYLAGTILILLIEAARIEFTSSIIFSPIYMVYLGLSDSGSNNAITLFYGLVLLPTLFYYIPFFMIARFLSQPDPESLSEISRSLKIYAGLGVLNRLTYYFMIEADFLPFSVEFFMNPLWIILIIWNFYWVIQVYNLPDPDQFSLFKITSSLYLFLNLVSQFFLRFILDIVSVADYELIFNFVSILNIVVIGGILYSVTDSTETGEIVQTQNKSSSSITSSTR